MPDEATFTVERQRLLEAIDATFADTVRETGLRAMDDRVRSAMAAVPRHVYVPAPLRAFAYDNRPLPIGHGQTISQPFIVALMTALLQLQAHERVLEIGSGCGYQTAVLAQLAAQVTSVEREPELSARAAQVLAAQGVRNVELQVADGWLGWPAGAPYDAVIATAAAAALPPAWLQQLSPGGRLVAPIGGRDEAQWLIVAHKSAAGIVTQRRTIAVRFVPLIHDA